MNNAEIDVLLRKVGVTCEEAIAKIQGKSYPARMGALEIYFLAKLMSRINPISAKAIVVEDKRIEKDIERVDAAIDKLIRHSHKEAKKEHEL